MQCSERLGVPQHIRCEECELVRLGWFDEQPDPPLPRQYCEHCGNDTGHVMVEIVVSEVFGGGNDA